MSLENITNQKYDVKSIQVEPDNMFDVLKLSKGLERLHSAYNEQFKKMNSQMEFVYEVESGQQYGNVSKKVIYPKESISRLKKIWSGGAYVELERDPLRPNIINDYWLVFDEEKLDPESKSYPLPALEELDPLTHVNEEGIFLQMTEEIPNYLAYWQLPIDTINSQWDIPKYYDWDEVLQSGKTTMTWGKPFFFSLIKQLRIFWNQFYNEIRAYDHEIIRETKMMSRDDNEYKIKTL